MNPEPCMGTNQGQPCSEPSTVFEPVPLCSAHGVQVHTEILNLIHAGAPGTLRTQLRAYLIATAEPAEFPVSKRHDALVYFIRRDNWVKIGYSTQIVVRLRGLSLRKEALLLLLLGSRDLEDALHAKFTALRIGNSEWFEMAPDILCFLASKNLSGNLPDLPALT